MPSINGITAFIETHDGPLPEFGHDEFSGGKSCYIPAQSGQQFWLHYFIHKPLPCKAASVEFYVDGQRVDSQFPLPRSIESTIGPIDSTIGSQYGRDTGVDGVEVAWRREVFFTLTKPLKPVKSRCTIKKGTPQSSGASQYGTIECKVFRSERSPEWAGAVAPDEFHSLSTITKALKGRHISHIARLGVKMEASLAKRFYVKSIDPDDTPFAWFKFYYRSRPRLMEKFKLDQLSGMLLLSHGRGASITQTFSLPAGRGISPCGVVEPLYMAHWISEASKSVDLLDMIAQGLEELAVAEGGDPERNDKIAVCHAKIQKLREISVRLRLQTTQLQTKYS